MTRDEKMQDIMEKSVYTIEDLVTIVELLRLPGGCPWDREQTHTSIRNNFIEETYEVIEAIDNGNVALLREELGDVLLQVVLHARMEEEAGRFDFNTVADEISRKLIHRHPHVFGNTKAADTTEVLTNWEAIKNEEKKRESVTERLQAVPRQYPALMRAAKVGKRAAVLDFADAEAALSKVDEELEEVREALSDPDIARREEEIGDLLFAAASLARKAGVDPETALTRAVDKFITRFSALEAAAAAAGRTLEAMSESEKDMLWNSTKKNV